jgi:hypothetical protein
MADREGFLRRSVGGISGAKGIIRYNRNKDQKVPSQTILEPLLY